MYQEAHQLYVHLSWCTEKRIEFITEQNEKLLKYITVKVCEEQGYQILALETVVDHVYLLVRFKPDHQISRLVKTIKGRSSNLITRLTNQPFQWQKGYAANTVGIKALHVAINYVRNQKTSHTTTGLKED